MAQIVVKTENARMQADTQECLAKELQGYENSVRNIAGKLNFKIAASSNIKSRLRKAASQMEEERRDMTALSGALGRAMNCYEATERRICANAAGVNEAGIRNENGNAKKSALDKFLDEFKKNYGIKDVLKGTNYIGTIYGLYNDFKKSKSWKDVFESGKKTYDFLSKAAKTYRNYKKIGNAVGTKTAATWWFKNITGLKKLGRVSTAKSPIVRFKNNLTNKTSPFNLNATVNDAVGELKGAKGAGKAVAAWGQIIIGGALNFVDNLEEQKNSNGTMSTERVIAETVTETAVDFALTTVSGALIGAAVTAVFPPAAVGVATIAISGAVMAGINAGVKAVTEKSLTEWISDGFLNMQEKRIETLTKTAKAVTGSVASWFGKLSIA